MSEQSEPELNDIQKIAVRRLKAIEDSTARILRKMEQNPSRNADYGKRLQEYAVSVQALQLELKAGVPVKIKDAKQMALIAALGAGDYVPPPSDGVAVAVPAGTLNLEGK